MHTAFKNEGLKAAEKIDDGFLINIKLDPFERSPETHGYFLWMKEKLWVLPIFVPYLRAFKESLTKFPPRQTVT